MEAKPAWPKQTEDVVHDPQATFQLSENHLDRSQGSDVS
jgi:hypothetical protein